MPITRRHVMAVLAGAVPALRGIHTLAQEATIPAIQKGYVLIGHTKGLLPRYEFRALPHSPIL